MMHKQNGLNLGRGFTSASGDQFNGFFAPDKKRSFQKDSLIDARARRVFDLMGRACGAGLYPFQIALESRTGPRVQAEGRKMLMLSSDDYLGLIGDPRINQSAVEPGRKYGPATAGSRLLTGPLDRHDQMEA